MPIYRFGNFCHRHRIPLIPWLCDILIRALYRCAVFSSCTIGAGTKFSYGGIGLVIHKRARIGCDCIIGTNVTIGGRSGHRDVPVLEDGVYVGTGAKVLGPIRIGARSVIGANAVVLEDVPADATVVGIPARIVAKADGLAIQD